MIPLFLGRGMAEEAESTIKYFLLQVVGSAVLFRGALINMSYYGGGCVGGVMMMEVAGLLMMVGLMVKVGFVPFHFWVPRVISGLRWESCFVLRV